MKYLKSIKRSAIIHSDPNAGHWGYSAINVASTPTLYLKADRSGIEEFGEEASIRGSDPSDSSSAAMKIIARVPRRLWVEFLLYTIAAIAIQILCITVK